MNNESEMCRKKERVRELKEKEKEREKEIDWKNYLKWSELIASRHRQNRMVEGTDSNEEGGFI